MLVRRLPLLCLALAACGAPEAQGMRVIWLPTYAFGGIGGGDLDLRDVCGDGSVVELKVGSSLATLGVAVATLGVYTPREARVRCADSP